MERDTGFDLRFGTPDEGFQWIGRKIPRRLCEDVVNHAQIKNFCALVQDRTPHYWDEDIARARFGAVLSPPGMLFVWSMSLPWRPDGVPPSPLLAASVPLPGDTIINVATDTAFLLPVVVGDRLSVEDEVTDVSPEKRTPIGTGHFLTTVGRFRNQRDELVAEHQNTLFRFSAEGALAGPSGGRAAVREESAELERLPETTMPVTLRLCVHDAAATRDFFPGHHDRDYARAQNIRDVYVNTMFLHGFVDRVGGEWAGPEAWLRRRRLEMVAPICVGDTMRTEGRVVRRFEEDGKSLAEIELRIATEHGLGAKALLVYEGAPPRRAS